MSDEKLLTQITGNAGGDAEVKETSAGDIVSFSMAVTMKYGDDPITRWVQVAVWDERKKDERDDELSPWQQRVLDTIEKGSKVAAEGIMKVRKVDGKTYYDLSAKRVGLVDWIKRGDGQATTKRKRSSSSDDDGEEPSGW